MRLDRLIKLKYIDGDFNNLSPELKYFVKSFNELKMLAMCDVLYYGKYSNNSLLLHKTFFKYDKKNNYLMCSYENVVKHIIQINGMSIYKLENAINKFMERDLTMNNMDIICNSGNFW